MATSPPAGLSPARLDPDSGVPLYQQIYEALRRDILAGDLRPGQKLAATRLLAEDLGVSRNTVLLAFEQLTAEGYLQGRVGAGTFVAENLPDDLPSPIRIPETQREPAPAPTLSLRGAELARLAPMAVPSELRPLRAGTPALDEVPWALWQRLTSRRLQTLSKRSLGYGDPAGYRPLREAVAHHLHTLRGIRCTWDQILVVGGSQQALDLAARVLLDPGDAAWVEDPGYPGVHAALLAAGAEAVPVSVDAEGIDVARGRARAPRAPLAFVSPSHQFPLGTVMSPGRRLALLEWAREADAWVVEDDYDSEFRYRSRPLAALKSLDSPTWAAGERVIYVGTFSKVLFPALRLGYLVVPPALRDAFVGARFASSRQSPTLDQAVLADFLAQGHFGRHLRRMRKLYEARQGVLVEAARERLEGLLEIRSADAGMHVMGWLPNGIDDREAANAAAQAGVVAAPLSNYRLESHGPPGLLLGYAAFREREIRDAVERLGRALGSLEGLPRPQPSPQPSPQSS